MYITPKTCKNAPQKKKKKNTIDYYTSLVERTLKNICLDEVNLGFRGMECGGGGMGPHMVGGGN
jgi:hypothetical protein